MTYRESFNKKVSLYSLIFLAAHLPLFALVAHLFETPMTGPLLAATGLLAVGVFSYVTFPKSAFTLNVLAMITMCFSAILIHVGKGMIELHFHIFVCLGMLPIFGYARPLLLAAATVAVHHLGFFFFLPASVFNYQASLGIVLLHATFVVVQTGLCLVIALRFKNLIEVQSSVLPKLDQWTLGLSDTSMLLALSSEELTVNSTSQAAATEQTAAALTELTQMVENNVKSAETTTELSRNIETISRDTAATMALLTDSMNQIMESNQKVRSLANLIQVIGEKTEIIDDIVFQTKLLSFNASVEAERAGEHGRGFSVVAQEIGNLAKLSGQSAIEISKIVKSAVKEAEAVSQSNRTLVERGVEQTALSARKVDEINQYASGILSRAQEVFEASKEQSLGIGQIKISVEQISNGTHAIGDMTRKTYEAGQQIAEQSAQMKEAVTTIQLLLKTESTASDPADGQEQAVPHSANHPASRNAREAA